MTVGQMIEALENFDRNLPMTTTDLYGSFGDGEAPVAYPRLDTDTNSVYIGYNGCCVRIADCTCRSGVYRANNCKETAALRDGWDITIGQCRDLFNKECQPEYHANAK